MKIDPDFSALADLVDQMGAERVNFVMDHSDIFTESDFSVQLEEGIRDFDVNDIYLIKIETHGVCIYI